MLQKLKFILLHAIPLLCISARETTKVCFLVKLRNLGNEGPLSTALLMLLAIYFSTNLGLRSDKGCRKRMLILTLIGSIAAMIILSFAVGVPQNTTLSLILYFSALAIDGILGSGGTPIGRASYLDVWAAKHKEYPWKDRLVTDTNIAQALPWVLVCFSRSVFEKMLIPVSIFSLFLSLILVIIAFEDLRDKDARLIVHEVKAVVKRYLRGYALRLMVAFLFYDLAFQFVNYLSEEFYNLNNLRKDFLLVEGSGIFLGGLAARMAFSYIRDFRSSHKSILIFSLALFSIFLTPWLRYFFTGKFALDNVTFLSFSSIGGVVLALSFGYFSHKVAPHETGLLFGSMEGVEIFAEGAISLSFFLGNFKQTTSSAHITSVILLILIGIGVLLVSKKDESASVAVHHH